MMIPGNDFISGELKKKFFFMLKKKKEKKIFLIEFNEAMWAAQMTFKIKWKWMDG